MRILLLILLSLLLVSCYDPEYHERTIKIRYCSDKTTDTIKVVDHIGRSIWIDTENKLYIGNNVIAKNVCTISVINTKKITK